MIAETVGRLHSAFSTSGFPLKPRRCSNRSHAPLRTLRCSSPRWHETPTEVGSVSRMRRTIPRARPGQTSRPKA
jgi:hypothetical protein